MHRKYFFIILALTAVSLFLILLFFFGKKTEEPQEIVQTVHAPFHSYINGVGVVEPKSGNIFIGIPFNRIVKQINVKVNDKIKKDDVLIVLENQDLIATLQVKQKEYEKTLANLHKLESLPQKEDLTIAEEALKKAQVALNASKSQYDMVANLPNPRAISKEESDKRLYRYQQSEAELREIQAQYEKIKSGTSKEDLNIAKYQVEQAQADIEALKTEIQRTSIKSPIDGTVLQIKLHEGETPSSDPNQTAIIVGHVDDLYLRVSIDQFNVSNFVRDASAIAYRQGDHSTQFPLEFIHVEPLMIHKKYLTNAVEEQIDTQILEILYQIAKKDSGLFIGEKMDVFIDKKK